MSPKAHKEINEIPRGKRTGESPQQNEEHHYAVFDDILEGAQIISFDWRYLYVNDAVSKHGRQPKENLLGHTMMDVYPGIENTEMFSALRDCMENRVARLMENEFMYPDGMKGWFELSIQPVPEGALIMSFDVTERVRAEKQVAQLKQLYATLSQINQTIVRVKDRDELFQAICGIVVEYGGFALAWIGLLDEESGEVRPVAAKGLDVSQWPFPIVNIHKGKLKNGLVATAIRTSKVMTSEDLQAHPGTKSLHDLLDEYGYHSSAVVPFYLEGKTIGILNLVSREGDLFKAEEEAHLLEEMELDISFALETMKIEAERRQAEDALIQSEERFRSLYENATIGMYRTTPEGEVLLANPALIQMLGYSSLEELAQRNLEQEGYDPDYERSIFRQQIERDGIVIGLESAWTRKDGETIFVRESAKAIQDVDGKVIYYEGTVEDITVRKQAEEKLRESEARYRNLVENMNDVVMEVDAQGNLCYVSPNYATLSGYSIADELGDSALKHVHPDDIPQLLQKLQQTLVSGRQSMAYRIQNKNGEWRWVETSGKPYHTANGSLRVISVARDITEREQAEAKLFESEERYRDLVENIQDLICTHDLQGNILFVNQAPAKLLGYMPEEFAGMNLRDLLAPEVRDQFDVYLSLIQQNGSASGLMQVLTKSGEKRVWEYNNTLRTEGVNAPIVRGLARDITERKQAEKKLIASELRYRRLFESAQDAILILEVDSGEIIDANPFIENLLEYPVNGLIGKQVWQISPFENIADNKTKFLELQEKKYVRHENLPLQTQSGKAIYVEFVSNVYAVGGVNVIQCNIRDITQRKRAEEKIERQNQRLKVLREIDVAILAADSVENIVGAALSHTCELIGCHRAGMALIDWEAKEVEIFDVRTASETSVTKGSRVPLMLFQSMPQAMSKPLADNQPVLIHDLSELPDLPPILQILSKEGLRSVCILPLFSQGSQIGTFNLLSEVPGFFDEERIGLGREVANQVAIAATQSHLLESLRESEEKYRTFFQNSMDAILLTTPDGGIQAANPTACKMLERTEAEICALGRAGVTDLADPRLDILLEERSRNGKAFGELNMLKNDGSPFPVEISSAIFRDRDGKERTSMIIRDITERKQTEEAIRNRNRMLLATHKVMLEIGAELRLPNLLSNILEQAQSMLDADRGGGIYLKEPGEDVLKLACGSGINLGREGVTIRMGKGVVGHVYQTSRVLVIDDYTHWTGHAAILVADPPSTVLGVPLFLKNEVIGVLTLIADSSVRKFTDQDVQQTEMFAAQTAVAIQKARLYQQAEQEIKERRQAQAALYKSERRYRRLFEDSPVSIWEEDFSRVKTHLDTLKQQGVTDFKRYFNDHPQALFECEQMVQILDVNNAGLTMYKANSKEELIKHTHEEISPGEREHLYDDLVAIAEGKTSYSWEGGDETMTGEPLEISLSWSVAPGHEADFSKVIVTTIDITERVRAEKMLSENEKRYRTTLNNMMEGCQTISYDWRYIYINDSAAQQLHSTPEQLLMRTMMEAHPGIENTGLFKVLQYCMETRVPRRTENEFEFADGTSGWFELSIQPVPEGLFILSIDITERKQVEKALQESEERFHSLYNNTTIGLYRTTPDGRVLLANPAAVRMLGYKSFDTLAQENIEQEGLGPDYPRREFRERLERDGVVIGLENKLNKKDGTSIFIRESATAVRDSQGKILFYDGTFEDITARKQAENDLHQRLAELETLYESGLILSQIINPQEIAQKLIALMTEKLEWHHVTIRRYHPEDESLELLAFSHPDIASEIRLRKVKKRFQSMITKIGEGLSGWVVQHGVTVRSGNLTQDSRYIEVIPGLQSGLYVPMKVGDQVMGVISIESERPDAFTEADERMITTLVAQAAVTLDNIQLFEDLQNSNYKIFQAYDDTIEGWSNALDLRDKETEGHTQRVTTLTEELAREMGISESDMIHIRRGALLHDIGKMGVPDRILLKPDKLTEEEWMIMQEHPVHAYNLLSRIEFLRPALNIPHYHHEKWDGTGYPEGLKDEQIPLEARIFAIIDVYDALTSDRPYRPGWPKKKAISYIPEQSGRHFDPQVVDAFLKLITR